MNTANPLHWIALLFVLAFVVVPSAAALIGVYLHAYHADTEQPGAGSNEQGGQDA